MARCHECAVRPVTVVKYLSPPHLEEFAAHLVVRFYAPGEEIFSPERKSQRVAIVRQGWVKIFSLGESGKEQILELVGPGGFLGEEAVLPHASGAFTFASALTPVEICEMPAKLFRRLLGDFPLLAQAFEECLIKRLHWARELASLLALEPACKRLERLLVHLMAEKDFPLSPSVSLLASLAGLTPETVSRCLSRWRREGVIKRQGRRIIFCYTRTQEKDS
ncbi:transcriptional regulator, Crp/Fnr family [Ammonifex degensii KC4]|uniref:Transcriptional regulator, Crp/Fnr family n=1 Tax=Ammonifex degensii (strain DSM 10501 / KC4) TaxID=429009 RepID=C9RDB7_AMMDK|nr:Crp/Fnr family transcriptional regulator [Ammonifex degensii]ACX52244.1 transcriptional regulator, Crp/Fnr family [Ammonifex degensii KC4]